MSIYEIRDVFMWCSLINMALLVFMFLIIWQGRSWVYKMQSKIFLISEAQFNVAMYSFLGAYKLLVFAFNIIPWIALCIVSS